MPVFDDDITGTDLADFGSSQVIQFALVHLDTLGVGVRPLEIEADDHILRAGWITFGHKEFLVGGGERFYWDAPFFLDFVNSRWHPSPATVGGSGGGIYAWGVRWHLSSGTTGHLVVG